MLELEIIKLKFKKKWFKEKDMVNKMSSSTKLCNKIEKQSKEKIESVELFKNKENFMNLKGYRLTVGEDSFILFEKEEDYLVLFYLEKVFFDFHNNLFYEKEGIRLFFRLSVLEKYIKCLREIKIYVFYDEDKSENPLKIKFPNMSYGEDFKTGEEIVEKIEILEEMNKLENIPLMEKYFSVINILGEIISVIYFKRYMNICSIFYEKNLKVTYTDKDIVIDTDTDTDTDLDTDSDIEEYIFKDTDTDTDIDRDIAMDKIIRKELYMKDLYDEDEYICEQVYIEAYNDIYDVN